MGKLKPKFSKGDRVVDKFGEHGVIVRKVGSGYEFQGDGQSYGVLYKAESLRRENPRTYTASFRDRKVTGWRGKLRAGEKGPHARTWQYGLFDSPETERQKRVGGKRKLKNPQRNPQRSFNPVDYFWTWTKDWYDWDRSRAIQAAKADRDATAKKLAAQGYKPRKWSLSNQRIRRGGIGTGHPEIDEIVTVFMLDY